MLSIFCMSSICVLIASTFVLIASTQFFKTWDCIPSTLIFLAGGPRHHTFQLDDPLWRLHVQPPVPSLSCPLPQCTSGQEAALLASSKCPCCLCGQGKIGGCTYKRHDSTTIPRGYFPRQKCRRRNMVNTTFGRIFFLPKFDDERMLHLLKLSGSAWQSRQVANARKLEGGQTSVPHLAHSFTSSTMSLPPIFSSKHLYRQGASLGQ